jgi:hypothetical protein
VCFKLSGAAAAFDRHQMVMGPGSEAGTTINIFRFAETSLTPIANHRRITAIPSRKRGRRPSSRTLGRVAVDAAASSRVLCARTSDAEAYGEVVWS